MDEQEFVEWDYEYLYCEVGNLEIGGLSCVW